MRPIAARRLGACLALCLLATNASAAWSTRPYVSLDVGHSSRGQAISAAASAGLRWPGGFGIALDFTPLDERREARWTVRGSELSDYRENSSTFVAASLRLDWRFALSEHWALLPTLGWHDGRASTRFPDDPPGWYAEPHIHHDGAVLGLGVERTLSPRWSASLSAKWYPSPRQRSMFTPATLRNVHRIALGLNYHF